MIIKRFELNKKVIDKFNFFLLYGKNEGLQNEIIKLQFIKNFTGEIVRYDEVEFLKNNEIIFTELLNKSLFENKKILLISRVTEKILKSTLIQKTDVWRKAAHYTHNSIILIFIKAWEYK